MAVTQRRTTPLSQTGDHDQMSGVEHTNNIWLSPAARRVMAVLRIAFGFTFLWAFLDKTFGLGFATPADRAWVNGGDPTAGFLANTEGTFASTFQSLAGQPWVSWLFMAALLGIGVALLTGAGLRIAAVSGALLYVLMYLAALPLTTNPVIDDHLTGAVILAFFALAYAGDTWGLGNWWKGTALVRRFPVLR
jgi:thiosulfate dehydrogenase [quinone] large subunit